MHPFTRLFDIVFNQRGNDLRAGVFNHLLENELINQLLFNVLCRIGIHNKRSL
ncbi:hypothetical protein [Vibrio parahaemolyticus RIMD 2210633]|uniref:Uncharacterized protein n=1 Tax=Vibrio parahaemolyticus serotype O3:K6 (strain RIMD 2210633) TaxID=223926 RepID=Q87PM9_VIBPA|nr:hypothetical protein [Vibrio parahaemolyticus RIMD 2210633]